MRVERDRRLAVRLRGLGCGRLRIVRNSIVRFTFITSFVFRRLRIVRSSPVSPHCVVTHAEHVRSLTVIQALATLLDGSRQLNCRLLASKFLGSDRDGRRGVSIPRRMAVVMHHSRSARVRRLRARLETEQDPRIREAIMAQLAAFDRTFVRP